MCKHKQPEDYFLDWKGLAEAEALEKEYDKDMNKLKIKHKSKNDR